jgi:hypothetical protein
MKVISANTAPKLQKMYAQEKTMLEEFIGEVITMSKNAVDKGKNYVEERKQSLVEGVFSPEDNEDILWHDDSIIVPQRGEYELAMNLQAKQRIAKVAIIGCFGCGYATITTIWHNKSSQKIGYRNREYRSKTINFTFAN